jgi:hypothetical protein
VSFQEKKKAIFARDQNSIALIYQHPVMQIFAPVNPRAEMISVR